MAEKKELTLEEKLALAEKAEAEADEKAKKLIEKAVEKTRKLREEMYAERLEIVLESMRLPEFYKKVKDSLSGVDNITLLNAIIKKMGVSDAKAVKDEEKKKKANGEKRTRPTYSDDFKRNAVQMVKDGKKKADVCRELNVTASSLNKWCKAEEI